MLPDYLSRSLKLKEQLSEGVGTFLMVRGITCVCREIRCGRGGSGQVDVTQMWIKCGSNEAHRMIVALAHCTSLTSSRVGMM